MAEIERWITTDEGNHLPIVNGKISSPSNAFEKALTRGANLGGTAKNVFESMNLKEKGTNDAFGNFYYEQNGNIYMEKHSPAAAYDTNKGWLPVDAPVGVRGKYIAPGSKDYESIKAKIASDKATKEQTNKGKTSVWSEDMKKDGFGGESIKPYELYKLAKNNYGVKMSYTNFARNGVDGIYNYIRDNKEALNGLKKYLNPFGGKDGKIHFSSFVK